MTGGARNPAQEPAPSQEAPTLIVQQVELGHTKLRAVQTRQLIGNLEGLASTFPEGLAVGTVCSGTDMPVFILNLLKTFWKESYGVNLKIRHRFACERSKVVQEFILRHHNPQYLFEDICALGGETAADVRTGTHQQVPSVDVCVGGTECDNYSSLNFFTKSDSSGMAATASGKSGSTLVGFMSYIREHRPGLVVWENSDRTKQSDLALLQDVLFNQGYITYLDKLDAKSYSPQSRPRVYLLGWYSQDLAKRVTVEKFTDEQRMAIVDQSWLPSAFNVIHQLAGLPEKMVVTSFLLPDTHDEVREWRAHRMQTKTEKASRGTSGAEQKYEEEHLEMFEKAGLQWPPDEEAFERAGLTDVVAHLPRRNAECVYYHYCGTKNGTEPERKDEHIMDINMRLGWQASGQSVPCLVSSSRPWIFGRRRDLTGAEALEIQGFPAKYLQHNQKRFSNPDLLQMAGNAMSGFVLLAVWIGIMTCAQWGQSAAGRSLEAAADSQGVDEDDDLVANEGGDFDGEEMDTEEDGSSSLEDAG